MASLKVFERGANAKDQERLEVASLTYWLVLVTNKDFKSTPIPIKFGCKTIESSKRLPKLLDLGLMTSISERFFPAFSSANNFRTKPYT